MKIATQVTSPDGKYAFADVLLVPEAAGPVPEDVHFNIAGGNFTIESIGHGSRSLRVRIGVSDNLGLGAFRKTPYTKLIPVYGGNVGAGIEVNFVLPGE